MLTVIITLLIFIVSVIILWRRKKWIDLLPPGPRALPILGNLLQFDRNDPRQTFVKWHKEYGPIMTVWIGIYPAVLVTGFDLMQEMFGKYADDFIDRPQSYLLEFFSKGKYGIANAVGDLWREQRRFTLHTLRNFGLGRKLMEDKIELETAHFISSIETKMADRKTCVCNLKPDLDLCIGNIITLLVLGRRFSNDDQKFVELKHGMDQCFIDMTTAKVQMLNSFPALRFVPFFNHFGYDNVKKWCNLFLGFWEQELEKHKNLLADNNEANDFVAVYLQEMKKRKELGEDMGYFSEWQLVCIMSDIWGAGLETSSTTLYWAILLMMHYPEVQTRIQNEIDQSMSDHLPDMSDRLKMPYTTAVINEIQRYSNILVSGPPRTSTKDVEVRGYKIPKGMAVVPQIAALHFDETVFKNAQEFHPDRFLESDGQTLRTYDQFMPFSLGKRSCPGEGLARMELFLIFTSLLQKFSFNFADNENKPRLQPKVGFTVTPYPYECRISRRN